MIKIYTKTAEELKQEQALYDFGAQVAKGVPVKAWPTYVMVQVGHVWKRVDLRDLPSDYIIQLIAEDLNDPNAESKGADSFALLKALKGSWRPTFDDVLALYKLEKQHGHIIRDIMGLLNIAMVHNAYVIAQYIKESKGDFTPVTSDDEVAVIEQMKINAFARVNAPNANQR